jgi:nucleotide-binding universal stress UspA family protein
MKLLCPTDFSKAATDAADVAAAIAAKRQVALKLVYCAANQLIGTEIPVVCDEDRVPPEQLEKEACRLATPGVEVTSSIHIGVEHDEIVRAAEGDTEMIVMGSTGRGGADRWLLGSVSERVAESAPVPTLVVRSAAPLLTWLREGRPIRVLCAVDFSVSADAGVAAVKELMRLGPVEVEAAYLTDAENLGDDSSSGEVPPKKRESLERDIWERLQQVLGCPVVKVHIQRSSGNPAFEFVRLADDLKADLVVVGTHQRHALNRLTSPSFSRRVLKHAGSNVLCVPLASYKPRFDVPNVSRVLVATDLGPASDSVIRYACSLLPKGGALRLLHVCPAPKPGIDPFVAAQVYFEHSMISTRATAVAEENLYATAPRQLATGGVDMTVRAVEHESVAAAICENAAEFGADVICMGSGRHSSAIPRMLLGSPVQEVIARSRRPVLVVSPPVV